MGWDIEDLNNKQRDLFGIANKKINKLKTTPKPKEPTESYIQDIILQYMEQHNIFHWRQNIGGMKFGDRYISFGEKGISDIIATKKGVLAAVEVKRNRKSKLSQEQRNFLLNVIDDGGYGIVCSRLSEFQVLYYSYNKENMLKQIDSYSKKKIFVKLYLYLKIILSQIFLIINLLS